MPADTLPLTDTQQRWLDANKAGAVSLARLVSIASLVDPGLLRAARIALSLPVAAELELRCSPIVSFSGANGLTLADEVLLTLRSGLSPDGLDLAWSLMQPRHAALSPALVLEETLTWQSLAGIQADAEVQLNRALVSIVRDGKTQLAAWAARALPRLPSAVRDLPSARHLASAVEATGYRNSPLVRTYGAPPSWMVAPKTPTALLGSVALYESTLELNFPPDPGHTAIPLPPDRRLWISWWHEGERVWKETTVPRNRPHRIAVDGSEITLEAPGFDRIVLRDRNAPRVEFLRGDRTDPEPQRAFEDFLRDRLRGRGITVVPRGSSPDFPGPASDFVLTLPSAFSRSFENIFEDADTARSARLQRMHCRPQILLDGLDDNGLIPSSEVAPPPQIPPEFRFSAIATFDCSDPLGWQRVMEQITELLTSTPPRLVTPQGVPALPQSYVRRPEVCDKLRSMLLTAEYAIVNLYGSSDGGRNLVASDVLNDCLVRRRYPEGILWAHDDNSWPDPFPNPSLFVFEDPEPDDFDNIAGAGGFLAVNGSCMLVLSEKPFTRPGMVVPLLAAGEWTHSELLKVLELAAAAPLNPQDVLGTAAARDPQFLSQLTVDGVVNLGRLYGSATRSQQADVLTSQSWDGVEPEATDFAINVLLMNLRLIQPFAACPPDWIFPNPDHPVWRLYFDDPDPRRVGDLQQLLFRVVQGKKLSQQISEAVAELALPTHRRIVAHYREQGGGDWAICPDDGYFLEFFGRHLAAAEPERISELTNNLDWLFRVEREAPDWHYSLPEYLKTYRPKWLLEKPNLELIAGRYQSDITQKGIYTDPKTPTIDQRSIAMAGQRVGLRNGTPMRRILVIGTDDAELPTNLRYMSECIGRELARWGYGLNIGGWNGVERFAHQAYVEQLRTNDISPEAGVTGITIDSGPIDYIKGPHWEKSASQRAYQCVSRSDAIIAIGGNGEIFSILQLAQDAKRPIFPIPGSDSGARTWFLERTRLENFPTLSRPLDSLADCYEVAQALIQLLPSAYITMFAPSLAQQDPPTAPVSEAE